VVKTRSIIINLVAFYAAFLGEALSVLAQTPGGSIKMQGPAEQVAGPIPKDAIGRPCLDIEAAARAQTVNRDMVDHVVSIKNNCSRSIQAKVCYANADRCNQVNLPAYKRSDTILGTMKSINYFRYTVTQK
jgi:hypothetical protein